MELTTVARACGKSNVHHLEREDLVALTRRSGGDGAPAAGRHRLDSRLGATRVAMRTSSDCDPAQQAQQAQQGALLRVPGAVVDARC